jgi:translation initiation factor IF-3
LRVVGPNGEQFGVMDGVKALAMASQMELDLVEIAPQAEPPVCKIMDYAKWRYDQDIKAKETRKRQSQVKVKEMKFRPKISSHDYDTKKGYVERFLGEGSKVKVTIMFRGREMSHTELGGKLLQKLADELSSLALVEMMPKLDGRNMVMVLAPVRKQEKKMKPGGSGGVAAPGAEQQHSLEAAIPPRSEPAATG